MHRWWLCLALVACSHGAPSSTPSTTTQPATQAQPAATQPQKRIVVTDTVIDILDPIEFLPSSTTLHPRSTPLLDAIASTLKGNPSIELVEVQAFAADALAQFRAQLAAERAQIIVDQLVVRGVERGRLTPTGFAALRSGTRGEPLFFVVKRTN